MKFFRFEFPKNPIDETTFLPSIPSDTDPKELKQMKADYLKIRKFLLRMTHGENFREEEKWKTFKNISFYDFLSEVGMFQSGEDVQDPKCQLKAKQRYLNALRCGARSGGILLLKRETGDIMTNNFNKNLIQLHRATGAEAHLAVRTVLDHRPTCCTTEVGLTSVSSSKTGYDAAPLDQA